MYVHKIHLQSSIKAIEASVDQDTLSDTWNLLLGNLLATHIDQMEIAAIVFI